MTYQPQRRMYKTPTASGCSYLNAELMGYERRKDRAKRLEREKREAETPKLFDFEATEQSFEGSGQK